MSIETKEDWAFSITVTIGAFADTYNNAERSALDSIEAFVAWGSAAARPWADTVSFRWSWSKHDQSGGAKLTLSCSDAATLTFSATATARLGFASATNTVWVATSAASGTWAPGPVGMLGVVLDLPFVGDDGDASAIGAVRPAVPGLAGRRPAITAAADALGNARLISILRLASNPRRAWVWQRHTSTWVDVALGGYSRQNLNALWYTYSFDAGGEVL